MSTTPHLGSVRLPSLANNRDEVLWPALMDLAAALPKPWTVIGGQMVYLHGLVVDRAPHRYTEDIDLVFDITLNVRAIEQAHVVLDGLGFEVKEVSAEGLAHWYVNNQRVEVDILVPDNVGERAATRLTTPAGRPDSNAVRSRPTGRREHQTQGDEPARSLRCRRAGGAPSWLISFPRSRTART